MASQGLCRRHRRRSDHPHRLARSAIRQSQLGPRDRPLDLRPNRRALRHAAMPRHGRSSRHGLRWPGPGPPYWPPRPLRRNGRSPGHDRHGLGRGLRRGGACRCALWRKQVFSPHQSDRHGFPRRRGVGTELRLRHLSPFWCQNRQCPQPRPEPARRRNRRPQRPTQHRSRRFFRRGRAPALRWPQGLRDHARCGIPRPYLHRCRRLRRPGTRRPQGTAFFAFKADLFQPFGDYAERADEMGQRTRAIPSAPDYAKVQMPGDPEAATGTERQHEGIPIAADTWQSIVAAAQAVGVHL